jgi:hypothetical protein
MRFFKHEKRKHIATDNSVDENALELCTNTINGIKKKADHNKQESLNCFVWIVVATLAAPMFITLGKNDLLGKIVPSILSLTATGATAWLQLRQPQKLWGLYRTAQRQLEDQHTRYRHKLGEYAETENPDKLLAEYVANVTLELHYSWLPLVPKSENLQGFDTKSSMHKLNQHTSTTATDNESTI